MCGRICGSKIGLFSHRRTHLWSEIHRVDGSVYAYIHTCSLTLILFQFSNAIVTVQRIESHSVSRRQKAKLLFAQPNWYKSLQAHSGHQQFVQLGGYSSTTTECDWRAVSGRCSAHAFCPLITRRLSASWLSHMAYPIVNSPTTRNCCPPVVPTERSPTQRRSAPINLRYHRFRRLR